MVRCYGCQGNGYRIFNEREYDCTDCVDGWLTPCGSFSLPPDALAVFRNQACYCCGVRENDHVKVAA
jgi:hypothetical protein